ncbi:uncharacterized protein I206_100764 [Kwoniella pini CBS 10737]|uniref:Tetratricopeptide repeat protein 1 n=1 Tax=Kwoniella pini CBS 10737 TaxID=1296096 RepID=A0A1B9ICB9_9TREE|nr:uncharacterized protein I206_00563 [Kwoniella pini CBS 10737]OCF53262.1 hypothetical protein I206_00563 [Kwoniella pini CBS 10737]
MSNISEPTFDDLPTFDARKFEPPSWAKETFHQWGENHGESSKSSKSNDKDNVTSKDEYNQSLNLNNENSDDEIDIWEDAEEDIIEPEEAKFNNDELKDLLFKAKKLKENGNELFKNKPPNYEKAIEFYLKAINHLPPTPELDQKEIIKEQEEKVKISNSGIEEVTDEEAFKIQENSNKLNNSNQEESDRINIQLEIKELTKAVWGNLAACYIAIKDDKKAVEACTEALKIDPKYVKGLHRRATSNERIGDLTALLSAKEDYTLLQTILPKSSTILPFVKKSLSNLSSQIEIKEKEQMDEMMGKLKEMGNSLLSNFGLSTDNFKFEKQDNGGWGMQFER